MDRAPDVSFVLPCLDEEEDAQTVGELVTALSAAGHALEPVCVDNGSTVRAGAILVDLALAGLPHARGLRYRLGAGRVERAEPALAREPASRR